MMLRLYIPQESGGVMLRPCAYDTFTFCLSLHIIIHTLDRPTIATYIWILEVWVH